MVEANELHRDVKKIAMAYDVDWDEKEEYGDAVCKALREDRQERNVI